MLSYCTSHTGVIKETPWVFKKLLSDDNQRFALFHAWSCVRVCVRSCVAIGQLFHLGDVSLHTLLLLLPVLVCWALFGPALQQMQSFVVGVDWKKLTSSTMKRLVLISSLQNIRTWVQLLICSCLLVYLLHFFQKVIDWFILTCEWDR